MTTTPVRSLDSAGSIAALEQVLRWLGEIAGEHIDWRSYLQSPGGPEDRPALIVIWDASESPFSCCGQSHRRPCPVYLDKDGKIRTSLTQHDCGAELAPARHVTKWLADLKTRSDVQAVVNSLTQWVPVADSWSLRSS